MHPAYSVILFTTATGAGYGLLALLGLMALAGMAPPGLWPGLFGLGLALVLITGGLLSSAGHLGRPERAWRAFSQWRSSWLSREGISAVATFVPAGLFGLGWLLTGRAEGWVALAGALAALGAVVTVCCTAMIYASLTPIAQWRSRFTLPGYLLYAAMSGLTLLNALLAASGDGGSVLAGAAAALTLAGWAWKRASWRHDDTAGLPATVNSATGLPGGRVLSIEWPHSEENYLLKEMGYRVARKHRDRLRLIAQFLGFLAPAVLLVLAALTPAGAVAVGASLLAALSQLAGLLVERWLFFAEARHTVMLYYGR
ncbi:dimethyl sulfoxide reductase anchor subunit family protein [Ancylobacter mangrovi]|uniref:dimethyl sulfoxide reductase anchor subunit family protein n=1 Tax=Ancylobacter mangrovi TaxID=2972472 RepID=UPI002163A91D|nr:DmsC/YnfH family molybdoenzyme membrane anchor subunit [Ancylobacter mangrovi]MCS0504712.1 dimethyl sulfoxide reductase anchor subunit [Ancylobacter mangrovi]